MFDPFASALVALFRGPGSAEAIYLPPASSPVALRVIRGSSTKDADFNGGSIEVDVNSVQILRSDIAMPVAGALLSFVTRDDTGAIASHEDFTLQGGPRSDVERLTWTCDLEPL
ncbi:head-tail joining protein [Sphingomonas nostoxanthinifaciens]|uniref:head-tail joining protein n=1 Tax=Sphingomonas nostoxanthinifaciens TaxID=2872652 RepID=UPI001CC203C2|nr:hypothetical protein [Sphingomonas nostoxanthinifaciens]UAK24187.1 hypothetical protein K8P63_17950 [Sphingomonas nostoxanthinifaciens]